MGKPTLYWLLTMLLACVICSVTCTRDTICIFEAGDLTVGYHRGQGYIAIQPNSQSM